MEKQQFRIAIDAPREKVWDILWSDSNYRAWTAAFSEGSHVITDWKKGSKALFLDGKGMGMVSKIADNKPNEYMSFEHIGMVKDGVEDTDSEKVKEWAGAHEDYTLKSVEGKTELIVEMDINDEWKSYFETTWPKVLARVKELAEQLRD
jgi:Activator of Hsp90 ATPase homolog 1-like protein.